MKEVERGKDEEGWKKREENSEYKRCFKVKTWNVSVGHSIIILCLIVF